MIPAPTPADHAEHRACLARLEHGRLTAEAAAKHAERRFSWTAKLLASFAGIHAAEAGIADCPFADPWLADPWHQGRAQGLSMPIPAATVTPLPTTWRPRPGTTHAALTAQPDA